MGYHTALCPTILKWSVTINYCKLKYYCGYLYMFKHTAVGGKVFIYTYLSCWMKKKKSRVPINLYVKSRCKHSPPCLQLAMHMNDAWVPSSDRGHHEISQSQPISMCCKCRSLYQMDITFTASQCIKPKGDRGHVTVHST